MGKAHLSDKMGQKAVSSQLNKVIHALVADQTIEHLANAAVYEIHRTPEFLAQLAREMNRGRAAAFFSQAVTQLPTSRAKVEGSEILAQAARELVALLPWWHHVELMAKVKDPAARLYYLRATAQFGWSRSVLLNQIKGQAYERALKEPHNFELALPEHFANEPNQSRDTKTHERWVDWRGKKSGKRRLAATGKFRMEQEARSCDPHSNDSLIP